MDIETLVGALNADERDELLERLTSVSEKPDTDDADDASGCCGGGRSMHRRHEMKREMRQMCCGAS